MYGTYNLLRIMIFYHIVCFDVKPVKARVRFIVHTHTDCLSPSSLLQSVSSPSPSSSSAESTSKLYKGTRQDASSVVQKVCLSPEKSAAQGRYSDTAPPAVFGEGQVTGHTLQRDPFVMYSRHFAHNPSLYSNMDLPAQPQYRCVFTDSFSRSTTGSFAWPVGVVYCMYCYYLHVSCPQGGPSWYSIGVRQEFSWGRVLEGPLYSRPSWEKAQGSRSASSPASSGHGSGEAGQGGDYQSCSILEPRPWCSGQK